jgi:hypothetical protein
MTGMGEAFFAPAASDVGNMVSELSCEFIHALNHGIGLTCRLFAQPAPVISPEIAQVFAAELHGKRDAFDVHIRIGKDARHVIERRETDAGLSTDKQGVVLAMSVRAGDQPVVRSCLKCAQIRVLPDRGTSIT